MNEDSESIDLIWGGEEIAKVIRRPPRITFHLLETGAIPAKKVRGRWVAVRSKLIKFFTEDAAYGGKARGHEC